LDYEDFVKTTDVSNHDIQFYLDGMNEENGEINGIFKRIRRGDYGNDIRSLIESGERLSYVITLDDEIMNDLLKEIGDRHWYTTRLLQQLHVTWGDIEKINMEKLKKRKETNTILGSGDKREMS